jgi:propionyl-CoA synthetase
MSATPQGTEAGAYAREYARALADPIGFWRDQADALPWLTPPATVLDQDASGAWRWFRGGQTNSCWLALDRHVDAGHGDRIALIYDSPVTGQVQRFTYAETLARVARIAGALVGLGVGQGDRVIIYMPMVPEAAFAMLACARIGAVHSVVFGGFAAPELATRIDDATPRVILSASCGIEFETVIPYQPLLEGAIDLATHKPAHVVQLDRPQAPGTLNRAGWLDWAAWEAAADPVSYVPVDATDPLYILYTSGTTGKPKGVVRDNGGHAVALEYSLRAIYDVGPGDVFWAASDVGWVVGHSYIVYGPLIRGCTSVLYEGKPVRTPDAGAYWRVIAEHRVKTFFVAPTAFRAIRKEDPECRLKSAYDVSSLRYQFVAGERLDPPTYFWLKDHLGIPVIDHWWQTETGWPICASPMGLEPLETRPGSPTLPVPGYDLRVLDESGHEVSAGDVGAVVLRGPLPPGALPTVWGDHQRFVEAYWSQFPGYYFTGDEGYRDADGYVYIMGRMDDVINVAGHRLSSGQMEEALAAHPAVAECAVVGIDDVDKGQVPLGLVVLKDGVNTERAELERELVQRVRQDVGPFASFRRAVVVRRLPKTRSGKILRQVLRKMIDGKPYVVPSTIDDPAIMDEIKASLAQQGALSA